MAIDDLPSSDPPLQLPPPPPLETRDVLNNSGQIIGTLSLPVGTNETIWTARLSTYSVITGIPALLKFLSTINQSATAQVTTSAQTPATIGGMTAKPDPGTYLAFFSGSIYTAGASAIGDFGVYINGVQLPETRRDISCNLQLLGGLVTVSLNTIGVGTYTGTQVDLDGTQTIDVRFRSTNGGTIGFAERTFILVRVK